MFSKQYFLKEVKTLLENNYKTIKKDCKKVIQNKSLIQWPEKDIYNGTWDVYGLFDFQGLPIESAQKECTETIKILSTISKIRAAGFSFLAPGTHITPHYGYESNVLRYHLGLIIPDGDCSLKVTNEKNVETTYKWEEGKAFVFDDTELHEAWNRTNDPRYVLIVDILKEQPC